MHRVVITGLGLGTSLGPDAKTCWQRLAAGENGIRRISFWDASDYGAKVAGEVREIPGDVGLQSYPGNYCRRSVRLFVSAAREAFETAGLNPAAGGNAFDPRSIGISCGVSVNYVDMKLLRDYFQLAEPGNFKMDLQRLAEIGGNLPPQAFFRRQGDTVASVSSRILQIGGPALTNDTACAASAHAIGEAYRMVRSGQMRAMLAGGTSALVTPFAIIAFAIIGALSRSDNPDHASRPFDKTRDGFVMGEGAGAVVLETLESARERGAHIYGELAGFGSSLNAHTLTDPSPGGVAEARAMQQALEEAQLNPEDVDYIAAHGTSTPKNDLTETQAIKSVFRTRRPLISSNKGQIGHTISAAGVCSLVFALKAMEHQVAPPTMHLKHPDPECDLDYVPNKARPARIRNVLVNAFAFGGQNAALAVKGYSA